MPLQLEQQPWDIPTAVQGTLACLLFVHAAQQAYVRGAPEHAAYPEMYAMLRLIYTYAGLLHGFILLLVVAVQGHPAASPHAKTCRPLVLTLWMAWAVLFEVMKLGLRNVPYAYPWITDCSEADAADNARLATAKGALHQLAVQMGHAGLPATDDKPWLCVAVPTVPRSKPYLTMAVGALLGGLNMTELAQVRMKVVSATPHAGREELHQLHERSLSPVLEIVHRFVPTGTFENYRLAQNRNYAAALDACHKEGLPYVLVIEDDAIATKGIVRKVASAIREVDASSGERWRVLKLFVTEYWKGHWDIDSTSLSLLLGWPLTLATAVALALVSAARLEHGRVIFFLLAFTSVAAATSFCTIAIGRANLLLPYPTGASRHEPPDAACAMSVANLYPLKVAEGLSRHLKHSSRPTDLAQCEYVTRANMVIPGDRAQWLFNPSLFQHVGRYSSDSRKNHGSCVYTKSSITWTPS